MSRQRIVNQAYEVSLWWRLVRKARAERRDTGYEQDRLEMELEKLEGLTHAEADDPRRRR